MQILHVLLNTGMTEQFRGTLPKSVFGYNQSDKKKYSKSTAKGHNEAKTYFTYFWRPRQENDLI